MGMMVSLAYPKLKGIQIFYGHIKKRFLSIDKNKWACT